MAGTPKLIVLSEQFRGRIFELNKDQLTVGRVDERDICIKDPTISTYHCKFTRSGNTYVIEDQGSTNGTRVNNIPVASQELQNSDIIQIGGIELLYDCDDKSDTTVIQQTQTGIDINAASQTQTIRSVERVGFSERKGGALQQKILLLCIIILALVVIALLAILVKGSQERDAEAARASEIILEVDADQP